MLYRYLMNGENRVQDRKREGGGSSYLEQTQDSGFP